MTCPNIYSRRLSFAIYGVPSLRTTTSVSCVLFFLRRLTQAKKIKYTICIVNRAKKWLTQNQYVSFLLFSQDKTEKQLPLKQFECLFIWSKRLRSTSSACIKKEWAHKLKGACAVVAAKRVKQPIQRKEVY